MGALGKQGLIIERIGLTLIPGLAEKPIVNIMLVVADCADEDAHSPILELAGLVLRVREPAGSDQFTFHGVEPHRVFKRSETDLDLHVWSLGSPEGDRQRSFREWLRPYSNDLALHERTPFELGTRNWDNVQQYADGRTAVIEATRTRVDRADQNGDTIGWRPRLNPATSASVQRERPRPVMRRRMARRDQSRIARHMPQ